MLGLLLRPAPTICE